MSYEITQKFISKNRSGQTLYSKGIVLHETGTLNATADNEFNYFNNNSVSASAHFFIDNISIINTVPISEIAWHAGKTANHNYLSVELCHFNDSAKFSVIYQKAVWLFANLFINKLGITTITKDNLMSHAEVSAKWHETDHVDPVSYFAQFGKTVDEFRNDVQNEINKQIKGDVLDMNKIVLYCGDADVFSAIIVAQKNQCPLMKLEDYKSSGLNSKEVIQIGGLGATAGGTNRFETFKNSAKLL